MGRLEAKVIKACEKFEKCKPASKGPLVRVDYKNIRIFPGGNLTRDDVKVSIGRHVHADIAKKLETLTQVETVEPSERMKDDIFW